MPAEVEKQSKIEIALELTRAALSPGTCHSSLSPPTRPTGTSSGFFEGLEARKLLYACGVKCNFGVRLPDEVRAARKAPPPPRKGTFGRKPKRHPAPLYRVDKLVADLPLEAWKTLTWRRGSKGPMRRQFVALHMHWGKGNQTRSLDDHRTKTSAEDWLIAERPLGGGDTSETKYYFSNLPVQATLKELAAAVRSRWPIEQFYQDSGRLLRPRRLPGPALGRIAPHVPELVMLSYSFLAP